MDGYEDQGAFSPRNRIGLSGYYFFTWAAVGFVTPFLPLYWRATGYDYQTIGELIALASVGGVAILIPVGILSDRFRTRKPLIAAGSLTVAACFLFYPSVRDPRIFAALQTLMGIGFTSSVAITSALGADVFRRRAAGRSFAQVRSFGTVGFISTMVITFITPKLTAGGHFFPLISLLHILAVISVLMVKPPRWESTANGFSLREATSLLSNLNLVAMIGATFLFSAALTTATHNLSLLLHHLKAPARLVPMCYATSAIIEIPFMLAVGGFSDRVGRRLPLLVAFLVLPVRLLLYSLIRNPFWVLGLQLTHGLTFSIMAVVPFAFVNDCTTPKQRATGQSILNTASALAAAAGPYMAGRIADSIGISPLYAVLAGIALVGLFLLLSAVREPERAMQSAAAP